MKGWFHPLGGLKSFERGTVRKLHVGLGAGQIWRAWDSRLRKNSTSHLFWLVQTCPDIRTIQWPCTLVSPCHFFHFRTLLFFSLASYPGEIAYFNSPNRKLPDGTRVMELYWNRNIDPSRSPCFKAIDRKSFERGNFLGLCPALLKLHISTQLIDSFPLPYCPKSCDKEKLSIHLEAHHNAQSSEIFLSFPP